MKLTELITFLKEMVPNSSRGHLDDILRRYGNGQIQLFDVESTGGLREDGTVEIVFYVEVKVPK